MAGALRMLNVAPDAPMVPIVLPSGDEDVKENV